MNNNQQNHTGQVHVSAYERNDGTDVREYWRAYPGEGCYANGKQDMTYNSLLKQVRITAPPKIMTVNEKILKTIIESAVIFPTARTNFINAVKNFKMAQNDPHATIFADRSTFTNQHFQRAMDRADVAKNSSGILYDSKSEYSNSIAKSSTIKTFIKQNYAKLKKGSMINEKALITFPWHNLNNFFGIQNATIFSPYIDEYGYFHAIVFDYYDFKHRKYGSGGCINNFGYSLQEKDLLDNYINIYYVYTNEY